MNLEAEYLSRLFEQSRERVRAAASRTVGKTMIACCIVYSCIVIAAGYNNHDSIILISVAKFATIKLSLANTHSGITEGM
jgi:hypothetical protein